MLVFRSLLERSYTVWRSTTSPDGAGGHVVSYIDLGTIAGRVNPRSAREIITGDQEEALVTHAFYCEAGEDVARGDLIEGPSGLLLEVIAVREPSDIAHHYELDCQERQAATLEGWGS